jgi:predicted enzyme related to lactoylglutathione lyase
MIEVFMTHDPRNNRIDYVEFTASGTATLGHAKDFYKQVFGWEYKDWGPEYADTQGSGVSSGIAVMADRLGRPLPVIFSSDLEGTRISALAAGAKLTKDIFSFPGGRRFQFADPAGNELAVWSDK